MILIEMLKNIKWATVNRMNQRWLNKSEAQYKEALEKWFYHSTGKELDLSEPKTFNEKIQWLKLYDSTQEKARLTDKLLVREYVAEKIGEEYLIPLLGHWKDVKDINFAELPEQYVLKTNHACGTNIIVADKSKLNVVEAKMKLKRWLKTNYALKMGFELHYGMISPCVICEKHMGEGIADYKVFCFNGKPEFIRVHTERNIHEKRTMYDLQWNVLNFKTDDYETDELERPKNLERMIEFAEILSQPFAFARVDFYEIDGRLYVGEITFTPSSGRYLWEPEKYNLIYGEKIVLPDPSPMPMDEIKKVWRRNG